MRIFATEKKRITVLLIVVAYILIPALVNLPYLISGKVMAVGDSNAWLNMRSFFADGFIYGDPSLWNPYGMIGSPFMADIQSGFFYPLNYLALIMPINIFCNVYYICTLSISGIFMYLFMTEMQKSQVVAFLSGVVFMFSTILGGTRVAHQNIYSAIIWLPLILFFIQRYIRTQERKNLLFSAIAMAVQFFAGFPQIAVYSNIFVFIYFVVFIPKDRECIKKMILDVFIWLGVFLMLIFVQLLPLAELIKNSGRDSIPFSLFSSCSADYKILPMMIFPELFNEYYVPFGAYQTTGMDIEIYMGVIPFIFLFFAGRHHLKDKRIRVFIIFNSLALLYCMIGNIPILSDIVWKLPVLGSFRAAARMLFIYTFFTIVIFGLIIEKLKDRNEAKRMFKFSISAAVFFLLIMLIVKALANTVMAGEEMKKYFSGIGVFSSTIVIAFSLVLVLAAYCYLKYFYQKKHAFTIMAFILCAISIMDVSRYSCKHDNVDFYASMKSHDFSEMDFLKEQDPDNIFRSIAVITTAEEYNEPNKIAEYKSNGNMLYRVNLYNAYLTFEPQRIRNFLKLDNALIMPNINTVIHTSQPQLSAVSIKYIVDPYHKISNNEQVITGVNDDCYSLEHMSITSNNGAINTEIINADFKKDQLYYIDFKATTDTPSQTFNIIFGDGNKNLVEDDLSVSMSLTSGENSYSACINTGTIAFSDKVSLIIESQSDSDIQIDDLKISSVVSVPFDMAYKTLTTNENTAIYENISARPIINVADKVADISQYHQLLVNHISYVNNSKSQAVGNDAQVKILEYNNNSIKAKVTASEEVFINHTQVMYPGWNAYVDGHKVENYLVNQAYQGTYVPMGEHIVEFRFEPLSLYIGAALTLAGIVLLIFLIIKGKARAKSAPKKDLHADK